MEEGDESVLEEEDDYLGSIVEKDMGSGTRGRRSTTITRTGSNLNQAQPLLIDGQDLLRSLQALGENMKDGMKMNIVELLALGGKGGTKRKKEEDWRSEDKVVYQEVVDIKDDSHEVLCWPVRNVLRNPNALPGKWWGEKVKNKASPCR